MFIALFVLLYPYSMGQYVCSSRPTPFGRQMNVKHRRQPQIGGPEGKKKNEKEKTNTPDVLTSLCPPQRHCVCPLTRECR